MHFARKLTVTKKKMTHAKRLIIKKISLSYFVKNESKYTKMHLSKLYNANTNKENSYE